MDTQKCAPRHNPNLPERQFREIGSPAVLGISLAMLEIMVTPIPPSTVVKYILDMVLLRGSRQTGVSALTIHATGLLISSLPSDHFVRPVLDELNNLVVSNPYLLEISEPTRLVSFSFSVIHKTWCVDLFLIRYDVVCPNKPMANISCPNHSLISQALPR